MALDRDITHHNWMYPPFNRRSFQRVREIIPTARIHNASGNRRLLAENAQDLDQLPFADSQGDTRQLAPYLQESYCDAIVVVHRGQMVYERYFNNMTPETPHLLMSVSKSVCAATLGIAIGRGLLAADDLVVDIAPELAGSSLEGATVQHLIDMSAGTRFDEVYDLTEETPDSKEWFDYECQSGYRPLVNRPPIGAMAQFRELGTAFPHGERFHYRSPFTNVVGRIVELANQLPYPDVVSRDIWQPLGQEHDASIMIDAVGQAIPDGGMSCTARDLARFGLAYLNNGRVGDVEVIPAAWIRDTVMGTDETIANFATSPNFAAGWSHYRNGFWVKQRGSVFTGRGIHGQLCWVDMNTQTVVARFSTFPDAARDQDRADVYASFAAISEHLEQETNAPS